MNIANKQIRTHLVESRKYQHTLDVDPTSMLVFGGERISPFIACMREFAVFATAAKPILDEEYSLEYLQTRVVSAMRCGHPDPTEAYVHLYAMRIASECRGYCSPEYLEGVCGRGSLLVNFMSAMLRDRVP